MSENVKVPFEEACRIISEKYPNEVITIAVEYDDYYVINTEYPNMNDLIRNPHAVDKKTGRIFTFNPLMHMKSEGKIIFQKDTSNVE